MNENKKEELKLFIVFLKQMGAYQSFRFNYIRSKNNFDFGTDSDLMDIINKAFPWISTREGYSFWYDTHTAWRAILSHQRRMLRAQKKSLLTF
jgi:hypothetical protein